MKKTITNQSAEWERNNSLWLVASVLGFGFGAFFYIGSKTQQRKWIIAGAIYSALFILTFISKSSEAMILFYYLASLIHSFKSKKEYLLRLEAIQTYEDDELKEKINNEYKNKKKASVINMSQSQNTSSIEHKDVVRNNSQSQNVPNDIKKYDINTCTESDFCELPGVNAVIAKKFLTYRENNGGFKTTDEFFEIAQLKPHFVVQIREMILCSKPINFSNTPKQEEHKVDRKLDI